LAEFLKIECEIIAPHHWQFMSRPASLGLSKLMFMKLTIETSTSKRNLFLHSNLYDIKESTNYEN